MKHEIQQTVQLEGRYKAIKHKGHKFDEDGNFLEFGEVIEETGWGKNIITTVGIDAWMVGGLNMWCVAGAGNSTPSESNTVLASYAGKQTTRPITNVVTRQTDPVVGDLYIRTVQRSTFNPGNFGASPVNIAEAGMTFGQSSLALVTASTLLFSRGLLVDGGGLPTTISVAPDEFLDIVWEFTVYVPYDSTGTVSLTIDGVPTNHTYYVRPHRLDGGAWSWTANTAGATFMGLAAFTPTIGTGTTSTSGTFLSNGTLVAPTVSLPTTTLAFRASTLVNAAYITGSKQRQTNGTWTLANGNAAAPGVQLAVVNLGDTQWQVSYNPPIAKTNTKQLNLSFMLSFANR